MIGPSTPRLRIKSDHLAAAAVTLAPVIYFLPAIRQGAVLCPHDGTIFNTPLRVTIANLIHAGHLPLWNPYIFSGMPLYAALQGAVLFPLNWFYLFLSAPLATNLMVVCSYVVAGLGAYFYARRINLSVSGAIVTSVAWQFGGVLIGQLSHINILHSEIMLPWVLFAVEGHLKTPTRKRAALIAFLVCIQVFAGNLQTFSYSLLLVAAYVLTLALKNKEARRQYLSVLAFVGTGVLLSAVQIVPTFELLRNSLRSETSYSFFTSFSAPPSFIRTFLAPYIAGGGDGRLFKAPYVGPPFYGEMICYVGVIGIMLAITAVVLRPDIRTKFWAIVVVVGLLLAFGRFLPFYAYAVIYYMPVLGLFRVPARHLMEVNFALAVLAGHGYTMLSVSRNQRERLRAILIAVFVFLLTCAVVTWGRPADFRLGRIAEVSFLRTPELFVPVLIAALSAIVICWFIRKPQSRRGMLAILMLAFDLFLWGQFTDWRVASPKSDGELFKVPASVRFLRERAGTGSGSYRILTTPHTFDPSEPPIPPSVSHAPEWVLANQPDIYMMHGIENAGGYDGFGLSRYSQLAGDMKVWGELTDPERTLRTGSREIDILNVRYLVALSKRVVHSSTKDSTSPADKFPEAPTRYGEFMFSAVDLGLNLSGGKVARFRVPQLGANAVAIVSNMSWSENVSDGTEVAKLRLYANDDQSFEYSIRAGEHTSEWAIDRPDLRARIRHKRSPVASSYEVAADRLTYQAHNYVASFDLPEQMQITGGEIAVNRVQGAPDLLLSLQHVSLLNKSANQAYPLRRDWIGESEEAETKTKDERWEFLITASDVDIYENKRALPRAWLATEARELSDDATVEVIRSGRFQDGTVWDPLTTALGVSLRANADNTGESRVEITRYEPQRVELKTSAPGGSILVLADNHYPGWRAYVDDRSVETLRVNYNLRGVELPPGDHTVTFVYRSKSHYIGLAVTLLVLAGLLLWSLKLVPIFGRSPKS